MFLREKCQLLFYKSELVAWNERKHLLEAKCNSARGHRAHGHAVKSTGETRTSAAELLWASGLLVEGAVQRGPEVLCGAGRSPRVSPAQEEAVLGSWPTLCVSYPADLEPLI